MCFITYLTYAKLFLYYHEQWAIRRYIKLKYVGITLEDWPLHKWRIETVRKAFIRYYLRPNSTTVIKLRSAVVEVLSTINCAEYFWRQLHENVASNIEQVLAATPHKAPAIRPLASHHENYPSQTNKTCRTQLEKQGRAHKWCTPMDPHIWPGKIRTTSSNIHSAAWWGYGM